MVNSLLYILGLSEREREREREMWEREWGLKKERESVKKNKRKKEVCLTEWEKKEFNIMPFAIVLPYK